MTQSASSPRVLLVEDQEMMRFLVGETIRQAGFEVLEASSGEDALAVLERQLPDLVVLDMMMPGMDGFDVCEAIRANSSLAHLPVLVMTALEDEQSIERAYAAGATDFISKPFKNVVLVNRIRYILRAHRIERRAHRLAYFDSLTGLPNRELFRDKLNQSLDLARKHEEIFVVLNLELSEFQRINELFGSDAGDKALKEIAARLQACITLADDMAGDDAVMPPNVVARMGSIEFAILLNHVGAGDGAALVAEQLSEALERPFFHRDSEFFLKSSIGISIYPHDAQSADSLHKCATTAMSFARSDEHAGYRFFDQQMEEVAHKRFRMDHLLRRAVRNNELEVVYQPQVNSRSGRVCGIEALLRWNSPELGRVSPADFIPLAEENGTIVQIGEWVLLTACAQASRWFKQGLSPGRIAVNISALQFAQSNFVSQVRATLEKTELQGRTLELEITESLLMKDAEQARKRLAQLKNLGVQLAIDDFGTGYSSLSYLKKFPVHRLKIDRSFVSDITTDPDDAAIATAVLGMASNMNLEVIAEGVETEAQLSFLMREGCTEFQGYYLSEPLSAKQAGEYLEAAARDAASRPDSIKQRILLVTGDEKMEAELRVQAADRNCEITVVETQNQAFELLISQDVGVVACQHPEADDILFKVNVLFPEVVGVDLARGQPGQQVEAVFRAIDQPGRRTPEQARNLRAASPDGHPSSPRASDGRSSRVARRETGSAQPAASRAKVVLK